MIKKRIKIGFINPGSLGTRHDEFLVALARHDLDILAVNETWLRTGQEERAPRPPGYYLRHIPRRENIRSRGGGVGFYIKRNIAVKIIKHPVLPPVEQMWLSVSVGGQKLAIGTAYRPPWLCLNTALTDSVSCLA